MTPTAWAILNQQQHFESHDLILNAVHFDVTAALPMIDHVADQLAPRTHSLLVNRSEKPAIIDHGGLAVIPADSFGIEYAISTQSGPLRIQHLCKTMGASIVVMTYVMCGRELMWYGDGVLQQRDDTSFALYYEKFSLPEVGHGLETPDTREYNREQESVAANHLTIIIAALITLNAKVAIRDTPAPAHSGRQKQIAAKLAGRPYQQRPTHVITINGVLVSQHAGGGGGSPKAFHFVRGHPRRTRRGTVPIRAHWRGDPYLGICRADYRLSSRSAPNE